MSYKGKSLLKQKKIVTTTIFSIQGLVDDLIQNYVTVMICSAF